MHFWCFDYKREEETNRVGSWEELSTMRFSWFLVALGGNRRLSKVHQNVWLLVLRSTAFPGHCGQQCPFAGPLLATAFHMFHRGS